VVVGKSVTAIAAISVFNVAAESAQRDGSRRLFDIGTCERHWAHEGSAVAMINQRKTADTAGG
jgi:hypothetical protein